MHVRNAEKSMECTLIEDKGQLTLIAPDLAALEEYAARFQIFGYEQSCIRTKNAPLVNLSLGGLKSNDEHCSGDRQ